MHTNLFSFLLAALLLTFATVASAQTQSDTIGINRIFTFKGEKIKKPAKLQSILFQEPVDAQVRTYWNQYKTIHGVGLGIEVIGVGVMGYGLFQSANGKGSGGTTIAGAALLLTGIIVDGFIARSKANAAARRYNDLKLKRSAFE